MNGSNALAFQWQPFAALSLSDFHRIVMAREAVFVVEQQCPYQETDAWDTAAWHLQVYKHGALAAYARVIPPGCMGPEVRIGRVLTLPEYRRQGIATAMMREALRFAQQQFPHSRIGISAQCYLQLFYASLGFTACSAPYDEDGIAHIDMQLSPVSAAQSLAE